jgi:hypothetical protein
MHELGSLDCFGEEESERDLGFNEEEGALLGDFPPDRFLSYGLMEKRKRFGYSERKTYF